MINNRTRKWLNANGKMLLYVCSAATAAHQNHNWFAIQWAMQMNLCLFTVHWFIWFRATTNTNSVRVAPLKRAHLPFCRWRAVVGANDDRVGSEVLRTHNDKYNVSTFRACISPTNRIRQMAKFPKQSHGHCHSISEMWIASPAAVCIFFSLVLHQNGTKPKLLKSRETFCRHSITASLELFDRWLSCFCLRLRGAIEKTKHWKRLLYSTKRDYVLRADSLQKHLQMTIEKWRVAVDVFAFNCFLHFSVWCCCECCFWTKKTMTNDTSRKIKIRNARKQFDVRWLTDDVNWIERGCRCFRWKWKCREWKQVAKIEQWQNRWMQPQQQIIDA